MSKLKVKNYKCFQNQYSGFDLIKPLNIIIGRNNTGKSTLLEIIEYLCLKSNNLKNDTPYSITAETSFELSDILEESQLRRSFRTDTRSGSLSGGYGYNGDDDWTANGQHYVGLDSSWVLSLNQKFEVTVDEYSLKDIIKSNGNGYYGDKYLGTAVSMIGDTIRAKRFPTILQNKKIRRILADRDIIPELPNNGDLKLNPNGQGATQIIERFLNSSQMDRKQVTSKLCDALNLIFEPDARFIDILCRQLPTDEWEIFLEEEHKGLVSLSNSGSGIKTTLLVLINLLLVPSIENTNVSDYFFCFEELENNLHPSLLRRLFKYLIQFEEQNNAYFFITTHSNIVIDIFSTNEDAQIVHVTHNGEYSDVKTIKSFSDSKYVIDDLGAKASDLMQANGIIWLEGPSDRIYFNKWVEIYAPDLQEHMDYECAFYGGALLKHFDAKTPEENNVDAINILNINKNSILIGDSDKTQKGSHIKPRLRNMKNSLERLGGYVWVSEAKEVENYLPAEALNSHFGKNNLPEIELYESFYYDPSTKKQKSKQARDKGYWQKHQFSGTYDKIELAHSTTSFLTKENLKSRFDLEKEMLKITEMIRQWNMDR